MRHTAALLVSLALPLGIALAHDEPESIEAREPVERGWTVRIQPSFWYVAPRGDVTLPGSVGPVEFEGRVLRASSEGDLSLFDADDPTGGFLGTVHLARDRWRLTLGGALVGTSGHTRPDGPGRIGDAFFTVGDSVRTEFDFRAFEASAAYLAFYGPMPGDPGDPERLRYGLEFLGGVRVEHIDMDVRITPGEGDRPDGLGLAAGGSAVFAQPIVGARLSLDFFDDFTVEVGVTAGYFSLPSGQTSSTWDVQTSIQWRVTSNVGIELGYRNLGLSGDDDGFEYRGTSAGLFFGLAMQF